MARKRDPSDTLLAAALELAAQRPWAQISLAEIAAAANISLSEAFAAAPSKAAILDAFGARIDREVLEAGKADDGDSPRDRLFDILMRRFDALQPHRPAVTSILRDLPADPPTALATLPRFAQSMAWMLEAAGLSSVGPAGWMRMKGVAFVYLRTLRVWMSDESADMGKTMAALDKNLRRTEDTVRRVRALIPACRRDRARVAAANRSAAPDAQPATET